VGTAKESVTAKPVEPVGTTMDRKRYFGIAMGIILLHCKVKNPVDAPRFAFRLIHRSIHNQCYIFSNYPSLSDNYVASKH
jgi:hypothetical protein